MKLTALDVVVLVLYLAGLTALGFYFSRRQHTREDYLLGGRQVHWLLAGGSVLASLLSTITFLAIPGEVVRYGLIYPVSILALPLILPVLTQVVIPMLRRFPVASIFELLEQRYSGGVRTFLASVFLGKTLLWMGLIVYSASFAIASITGWSIWSLILLMGLSTTLYTSQGGLRTVIWTDNLQLAVLLGGALAVPFAVWSELGAGPADWLGSLAKAGESSIPLFSWNPAVRLTLIGMAISSMSWNVCAHASDQVAVQRYLSTASQETAQRSARLAVWMNVAATLLLGFCGVALFAFYQRRSGLEPGAFQADVAGRADRLLPQFLVEQLPSGVSGLVLAALLAAAMSSLSSGINSISGVLVKDFFERFGWFSARSGSIRLDKALSAGIGLMATGAAAGITLLLTRVDWNLVEVANRVNNLMVGPIAVPVFATAFFRRAPVAAALAGFAVATGVAVAIAFGPEIYGLGAPVSFMWIVPVPLAAGMAVAWVVSRATSRA